MQRRTEGCVTSHDPHVAHIIVREALCRSGHSHGNAFHDKNLQAQNPQHSTQPGKTSFRTHTPEPTLPLPIQQSSCGNVRLLRSAMQDIVGHHRIPKKLAHRTVDADNVQEISTEAAYVGLRILRLQFRK